jgi:hypothetical protein
VAVRTVLDDLVEDGVITGVYADKLWLRGSNNRLVVRRVPEDL